MLNYGTNWVTEEIYRLSHSCESHLNQVLSFTNFSLHKKVNLLCDRYAGSYDLLTDDPERHLHLIKEIKMQETDLCTGFLNCCFYGEEAGILFGKTFSLYDGHKLRISRELPDNQIHHKLNALKEQGNTLHTNVSEIVERTDIKLLKVLGTFDGENLYREDSFLKQMLKIRKRIEDSWF